MNIVPPYGASPGVDESMCTLNFEVGPQQFRSC